MDYEIQRCTRRCAATEREFAPGEEFFSVLVAEGAELRRLDYCAEAWEGPPENATGNWVKVTQRFAVRIRLLDPVPELRVGASAEVTVDTTAK